MVTPAAERKAVAHLMGKHGMSERRACKATGFCRMTMRYRAKRGDNGALRERMKAIAHERRRFGYRRLHVLLRREGFTVSKRRPVGTFIGQAWERSLTILHGGSFCVWA